LVSGPTLTRPTTGVKLARILSLETDLPSRIAVRLESEDLVESHEYPGFSTEHSLPIFGFRPDRSWDVTITVTGEAGGGFSVLEGVETDPLPELWPQIEVHQRVPEDMAPGLTLLPLRVPETFNENIIALDAAGEVVWWFDLADSITDVRLLDDGTLLAIHAKGISMWDMLGNELGRIEAEGDLAVFHHEVGEGPADRLITLGESMLEVVDYPQNYNDPNATKQTTIVDDVVVLLDRAGDIAETWSLAELLDTARVGYGSVSSIMGSPDDWAHTNSVFYDPMDDTILVSLRHQDAVVKFDRSGELRWILANHDNWSASLRPYLLTPVGEPFSWPYHQHAAMLGPDGSVLLFDNGNYRASPFTGQQKLSPPETWSRAVAYEVDEQAREIRQSWAFSETVHGRLYCDGRGDADYLEGGNILVNFGHSGTRDGVDHAELGIGERAIHLSEVTPTGDVVWEVSLVSALEDNPQGWTANRAQRIASLYTSSDQ